MKKILFFIYSTVIIASLSNNYCFGQASCSASLEYVDFNTSPGGDICVNYASTFRLDLSANYIYKCDEYGSCYESGTYNDITIKRPDGSVAFVITEPLITILSSNTGYYILPVGFFNVVGNWTFSFAPNCPSRCWPARGLARFTRSCSADSARRRWPDASAIRRAGCSSLPMFPCVRARAFP